MKKILNYFGSGLLVAIGGLVFSGLFASIFNGLETGSGCAVGMGVYLCVVVVVCTGIIVNKIETKLHKDEKEEMEK